MEPVSSNAQVSVTLIHISTSLAWPTKRFTVDSGLDEYRPTFRPPEAGCCAFKGHHDFICPVCPHPWHLPVNDRVRCLFRGWDGGGLWSSRSKRSNLLCIVSRLANTLSNLVAMPVSTTTDCCARAVAFFSCSSSSSATRAATNKSS